MQQVPANGGVLARAPADASVTPPTGDAAAPAFVAGSVISLDDPFNAFVKRCMDVVGSLIALILFSPVMVLAAIAIKLDSRGPVFFSTLDDGSPSRRVGKDGRNFTHFKFRTMAPGTHMLRYTELAHRNMRAGSPLVKIKDDPRITRVGAFIRRYSIDEMAEFFLVLKGDMSLVGPRPHLPEEVARYEPWQLDSLRVKPGITGLAQVSGRADLPFEDEAVHNHAYVHAWSLALDLAIIAKTPFVVLFGRGAY